MSQQGKPAKCPSIKDLRLYLDELLEPGHRNLVAAHIEECDSCLQRLDDLTAQLQFSPVDQPWFQAIQPDAQRSAEPRESEKSFRLPHIEGFEILEEIGRGGMGTVFSAIQKSVDRKVAIKLIRRDVVEPNAVKRFQGEQSLLASVNHPNIAKFYFAGESGGIPFFVMEHIRGASLIDYCNQNRLDLDQRILLFLSICNAIQYLHSIPIVHRDLTSHNILVEEIAGAPSVKVIDFGLAKLLGSGKPISQGTAAFTPLGTFGYMSPEHTGQFEQTINTVSDVFSLGCILYELLTGETPIPKTVAEGLSHFEILKKICDEFALEPSRQIESKPDAQTASRMNMSSVALANRVRGDLDWVVSKAIRKEPHGRYQTVEAFQSDIKNFLDYRPVLAKPQTKIDMFRKFVRRNRLFSSLVAACAALLILGLLGTGYGLVREANARKLAEGEERKATAARNDAVRAQQRVEEEQANLEKASEMLRGFFDGINPEIASGGDGQFRESLLSNLRQTATDLTTDQFSGNKDVWELKKSLAQALVSLGEAESALPLWKNILNESKRIHDPNSRESLESLIGLGLAHWKADQIAESKTIFESALLLAKETLDPNDKYWLSVSHYASSVLDQTGDIRESYRIRLELVPRVNDLKIEDPDYWNDFMNSLGVLQLQLEKYDEAKLTFIDAIESIQKQYSPSHPVVLSMRSNLAFANQQLGDLDSAESEYRKILDSTKSQFPGNSIPVGFAKLNLASLLCRNGKVREAVSLIEKLGDESADKGFQFRAKIELAAIKIIYLKEQDQVEELKKLAKAAEKKLGLEHGATQLAKQYLGLDLKTPLDGNEKKTEK